MTVEMLIAILENLPPEATVSAYNGEVEAIVVELPDGSRTIIRTD